MIAKGLQPFRRLSGAPISSWLSKPIHQQRSKNVELGVEDVNAGEPQVVSLNIPSKAQSAPEILGVIPERKNEEI
jgi:hypothetical protein